MALNSPIMASNKYKTHGTIPKDKNVILLRDNLYLIRFPVHKFKEYTTIEGSVIISKDGEVLDFKVYDTANKLPYPPFYSEEDRRMYSKRFIRSMENAIKYEFNKLGIEDAI